MKTNPASRSFSPTNTIQNNERGFSRRRFITSATVASSAMVVPVAPAFAGAASHTPSALCASDFRRHLTSEFHAAPLSGSASDPVLLKLADVAAGRHAHPGLSSDAAPENVFSLKFTVAAKNHDAPLSQDTYWVKHATLGEFALLMVPTQSGRALRAEFHRL
jgi:hypothetical protein